MKLITNQIHKIGWRRLQPYMGPVNFKYDNFREPHLFMANVICIQTKRNIQDETNNKSNT